MAKIFLNDGAPWPKNSLTSLESYHLCIFPMFRQILTRRKAIVLSIEIHFQILGGVLLYHNSVDLFNHCEDDASENIRCTLKTIAGCISTACHNARGRVKSSSASASSSVSLGSKKKGSAQRDRQTHFLGPIGVSSLPREQSGYRASCSILNPLQGCSPRSGGRLLGISIGSYFAIVKELLNAFEQSCAEGRIVGAQHSSSAGGDLFLPRSRRNNNESMMRYACTMWQRFL